MADEPDQDEVIRAAAYNAGFNLVPIESLYEALEKMEEYLMYHTGLGKQELSDNLVKLENLVGEEQVSELNLDEIVKWIKAFQV